MEKVINGVLCHGDFAENNWVQFTPEALTIAYISLANQLERREKKLKELENKINELAEIIKG